MAVWSTEVANELISLSRDNPLTHMQIQKMVYLSHGWSLAINDRILTIDDPQAWKHGPVYRLIWDELKYNGYQPVIEKIINEDILVYENIISNKMDTFDIDIVDQVYESYHHLKGFQLSGITHKKESPWDVVYNNGKGMNKIIPSSLIKEYFYDLSEKSA